MTHNLNRNSFQRIVCSIKIQGISVRFISNTSVWKVHQISSSHSVNLKNHSREKADFSAWTGNLYTLIRRHGDPEHKPTPNQPSTRSHRPRYSCDPKRHQIQDQPMSSILLPPNQQAYLTSSIINHQQGFISDQLSNSTRILPQHARLDSKGQLDLPTHQPIPSKAWISKALSTSPTSSMIPATQPSHTQQQTHHHSASYTIFPHSLAIQFQQGQKSNPSVLPEDSRASRTTPTKQRDTLSSSSSSSLEETTES